MYSNVKKLIIRRCVYWSIDDSRKFNFSAQISRRFSVWYKYYGFGVLVRRRNPVSIVHEYRLSVICWISRIVIRQPKNVTEFVNMWPNWSSTRYRLIYNYYIYRLMIICRLDKNFSTHCIEEGGERWSALWWIMKSTSDLISLCCPPYLYCY